MKKKRKIKETLIFTLMVIVLPVAVFFVTLFLMKTPVSISENNRYTGWEKFKETFEKEMEQFGAKTFENSQLREEREKKNPLPVELRRERFVVFSQTIELQKKYLTAEEYGAFCLLYRDMQERKLDTGEVKLMMYLVSKVTDKATPEEKKIFEEGNELEKKINAYYAQVDASAKGKK